MMKIFISFTIFFFLFLLLSSSGFFLILAACWLVEERKDLVDYEKPSGVKKHENGMNEIMLLEKIRQDFSFSLFAVVCPRRDISPFMMMWQTTSTMRMKGLVWRCAARGCWRVDRENVFWEIVLVLLLPALLCVMLFHLIFNFLSLLVFPSPIPSPPQRAEKKARRPFLCPL